MPFRWTLNHAQRSAGNSRPVRGAHCARQLRICRGMRPDCPEQREEQQNPRAKQAAPPAAMRSSTRQRSRPFVPLGDTAFPFPRFHYSLCRGSFRTYFFMCPLRRGLNRKGYPAAPGMACRGRAKITLGDRFDFFAGLCHVARLAAAGIAPGALLRRLRNCLARPCGTRLHAENRAHV